MNKFNSFKDSSFEKKYRSKEKKENNKLEKVLCNHCGRTKTNGIRCLGICVSDNDYYIYLVINFFIQLHQ